MLHENLDQYAKFIRREVELGARLGVRRDRMLVVVVDTSTREGRDIARAIGAPQNLGVVVAGTSGKQRDGFATIAPQILNAPDPGRVWVMTFEALKWSAASVLVHAGSA